MGKQNRISTVDMTREAWLQARKGGIGGSDIGAILGMNPYRSAFAVWAEKIGMILDAPDNEAMRQGRDMEDYVAHRFQEASRFKVHRVNAMIENDAYPHIRCNVDRLVAGQHAGLECKTASALGEKRFRDGSIPEHYYAQCVAYMAVTEFNRWYLAVLVLGRDFKVYQLTRIPNDETPGWCESSVYVPDEEFASMRDMAIDFWQHVETKTPPPIDGSASTTAAISTMYPESAPDTYADLSGFDSALATYRNLKAQQKEIETALSETENQVKEFMGDAETGTWDGGKITFRSQVRNTFDSKRFISDHPQMDVSKYIKSTATRPFKVTFAKGE